MLIESNVLFVYITVFILVLGVFCPGRGELKSIILSKKRCKEKEFKTLGI